MVFLFIEGGGFSTEDGLPKLESGDLWHASMRCGLENCFLSDSGVLISGIEVESGQLIRTIDSTGESGSGPLMGSFVSSSVKSFRRFIIGSIFSLLRMDEGDLVVE